MSSRAGQGPTRSSSRKLIINVFTNSIKDEGSSVIIKDGFIASVEEDGKAASYRSWRVSKGRGRKLPVPRVHRFTHPHRQSLSLLCLVPYAIRGGTTTVVTETSAVARACGMEGVTAFTKSTRGYPCAATSPLPPLTPFPEMESLWDSPSRSSTFSRGGRTCRR